MIQRVLWRKRAETELEFSFCFFFFFFFFFFCYCCSSKVLVRWYNLHSSAFSLRSLFRAHPKIGSALFVSHYIFVFNCRHASQANDFQTQAILLCSPIVGVKNQSVFRGFTPALKVWDLRFIFQSFLITEAIYLWLADLQRVLWPDFLKVS